MKTFKERFKYAICPYLLISIATTIVADITYYFLFVVNPSAYSKGVTNMLMPLCFAAVIQLIVVLPFINRFELTPKQNRFGVNFLSFMLLCAPLLVSIPFVRDISADVVAVNKVSEIAPSSNQYCYVLKNTAINLNRVGESFWTERKHRKHGKDYTELNIVVVAPLMENGKNNLKYWLVRDYSRNEGATIPADAIEDFRAESLNDFSSVNTVQNIVYVEKTQKNWIGNHTLEAINDIMYNSDITDFVVLKPHYSSLAQETNRQGLFLFLTFIAIIFFWGVMTWGMKLKQNPAQTTSKQDWMSRNRI